MTAQLNKQIKYRQLFTIGFGSIIGVGWMIMAGVWISTAGPIGAIIAFLIGAFAISIISFCYGELGSAFPHSGGDIVYAYEGFGTKGSFIVGWFLALIYISICAFLGIAAAWLITVLFPIPTGPALYSIMGKEITVFDNIVSALGTFAFYLINSRGGATMARFQEIFTWIFLAVWLLFLCVALIYGDISNLSPTFLEGSTSVSLMGVFAMLAVVPVWYGGFNLLPQALGELSSLDNLSKFGNTLLMVLLAAAIFYSGVILATAMSLPRLELQNAELPVADALYAVAPTPIIGHLVLITGLVGILTSWNACFYAATRVLFALGRSRIISPWFSIVDQKRGIPKSSILFVAIMSFLGSLLGQNSIAIIINMIGLIYAFLYLIVALVTIKLQKTHPDLKRPFSVPNPAFTLKLAIIIALSFIVLASYSIWQQSVVTIPFEFIAIIAWVIIGFLIWTLSKESRNAISEDERAQNIHSR